KVRLNFGSLPAEAGNFGIYKKEELLEKISFNYSRTESDLSLSNKALLGSYKAAGSIDAVFDTLQSDRTDSEIWKWFVFLALLFLAAEILIQKLLK
ncbi:MAG TPA: hypothetical protein VFR70_02305, partial [Flavobacterium sp.]|nr:hypothetical protein [Flavobacterium sp.]